MSFHQAVTLYNEQFCLQKSNKLTQCFFNLVLYKTQRINFFLRATRLFASKDGRKTLLMHKYGEKDTPLQLSVEWPLQTFTHT